VSYILQYHLLSKHFGCQLPRAPPPKKKQGGSSSLGRIILNRFRFLFFFASPGTRETDSRKINATDNRTPQEQIDPGPMIFFYHSRRYRSLSRDHIPSYRVGRLNQDDECDERELRLESSSSVPSSASLLTLDLER
jgi:hypothetical protein